MLVHYLLYLQMSCCSTTTKEEFLQQKLKNFKAYLEPFHLTDEQRSQLNAMTTVNDALPFLLQVKALRATGGLNNMVDTYCHTVRGLSPEDLNGLRAKVLRYMEMFCDLL
jgi:hypothetical protein